MRIIYDIILFVAVLFSPFWLLVLLAILGIIMFPKWYEFIAIFALFDLLYRGDPTFSTHILMVPLALYALFALLCVELVRKRIRKNVA